MYIFIRYPINLAKEEGGGDSSDIVCGRGKALVAFCAEFRQKNLIKLCHKRSVAAFEKRGMEKKSNWSRFLGAAHETNTFLDICRRCCKQEATLLQLWMPHKSSIVEQLLQALDRIQIKIELVAK